MLVTLALMLAGYWTPWAIFLPTSFGALFQGVALPNTQAAFVSVDPQAAGTASGLGGFLQMGLAALVAQIVGSIQDDTPYPMAIGMCLCAAAALLSAVSCSPVWQKSGPAWRRRLAASPVSGNAPPRMDGKLSCRSRRSLGRRSRASELTTRGPKHGHRQDASGHGLRGPRPMTGEERKVIVASSLGTVFEWYDFYLYGSLAA